MRISLLLLAVVLSACGDDESKAPLSPGGGPGTDVSETPRDGGRGTVDDTDAGSTSDAGMGGGPMPLECARIEAVKITSDEVPTVTATEAPADFSVTRQVATWTGECPSPAVLIELSNGGCPKGLGHELQFWFPANSILDGQFALGFNTVEPDFAGAAGIRVRYTRPAKLSAAGVYGNCDGASGQITLYDAPDITRATNWRASFELMLTACDDKANAPLRVSGYFDVRVRRDLASVCPTTP
jgi:hypothetical protein